MIPVLTTITMRVCGGQNGQGQSWFTACIIRLIIKLTMPIKPEP